MTADHPAPAPARSARSDAQRLITTAPELGRGRLRLLVIGLVVLGTLPLIGVASTIGSLMLPGSTRVLTAMAAGALCAGLVLVVWAAVRTRGNRSRVAASLTAGRAPGEIVLAAPTLIRSSLTGPLVAGALVFVLVAGAVTVGMVFADATRTAAGDASASATPLADG
jgi:uncharacterized membrane protein YqjE